MKCFEQIFVAQNALSHVIICYILQTDKQLKMTSLIAAFLALMFAVNLTTLVLSQNEQICLPVPRDALGTLQGA